MAGALALLGFRVGRQPEAELLFDDWVKRDFHRIINFCKTADAYQDIPFSLDYTYQILDHAFPSSKFILTVRSSSQEWYESLTSFHTKLVGKGRLPTPDDLKQFPYRRNSWFRYRRKGWLWRVQQIIYGIDESALYDKAIYIAQYEAHNQSVLNYFLHRPEDLLILNLSELDAMQSLCNFLGVPFENQTMPHENRS